MKTADAHRLKRIQNGERVARLEEQGFNRSEIAEKVGLSRKYVGQLLMEHQARVIQLRNRSRPVAERSERLADVERDPQMQPVIARLGGAVSEINSASIDIKQHILGVASVVRAARLR